MLDKFNWRYRLALLIAAFVLVEVIAVVVPSGQVTAEATQVRRAVGYSCTDRSTTFTLRAGVGGLGPVIGRATWTATGCWWNNNSGVKSLTLKVDGYANAPYHWQGTIGNTSYGTTCAPASTCTHQTNHQVGKGKRVGWEFCALGSVACQNVGTRLQIINVDSYGNMWWTT